MIYKQSEREKSLRRVFRAVREARLWDIGSNHPDERANLIAYYEIDRQFLQNEIQFDRSRHRTSLWPKVRLSW